MIEFLISVLLFMVIVYVIYLVVGFLKLPSPISQIVYLILGLVFLFWILDYVGIYHSSIGRARIDVHR